MKKKMYILIKKTVPDNMVPVIAAHGAVACYKKYEKLPDTIEWINGNFAKVVCMVNEKEFIKAAESGNFVTLSENSLGDELVCIAFAPSDNPSNVLKYAKLWKPRSERKY